jgi:hypothetical protein
MILEVAFTIPIFRRRSTPLVEYKDMCFASNCISIVLFFVYLFRPANRLLGELFFLVAGVDDAAKVAAPKDGAPTPPATGAVVPNEKAPGAAAGAGGAVAPNVAEPNEEAAAPVVEAGAGAPNNAPPPPVEKVLVA